MKARYHMKLFSIKKFVAKPVKPAAQPTATPGMPLSASIVLNECKDLYNRRREIKEKVEDQFRPKLALVQELRSVEKLLYLKLSKILSLISEFEDVGTMHGQPASMEARNELVTYWNAHVDVIGKLKNPKLYEIE